MEDNSSDFLKGLEKKWPVRNLFHTTPQLIGNKYLSVKLMSSVVQHRLILWLHYSHLYSVPWSENLPQTKNILHCPITEYDCSNTFYNVKHDVFLNSGRHRNLMHLTVRTGGTANVTYSAELL